MIESVKKRSVVAVLKQAKKRLSGRWCQGTLAADTHGNPVPIDTPGCRCCIEGAIHLAVSQRKWSNRLVGQIRNAVKSALPSQFKTTGIAAYNDAPRRTEKQVLALFDRAIERTELQ